MKEKNKKWVRWGDKGRGENKEKIKENMKWVLWDKRRRENKRESERKKGRSE